jgi:GT2 family glycosyltransferase
MEARRKRYPLREGFRGFEDIFVFSTTFPGTAVRRSAFLRTGGFAKASFPMEDVVFQLEAAAAGIPVFYLDEVLADYRMHSHNASAGREQVVRTCEKKVEALTVCRAWAPAGTRPRPLRRRQADAHLELAIAHWWVGQRTRAALDVLNSLMLSPTVAPRIAFERLRSGSRRAAPP